MVKLGVLARRTPLRSWEQISLKGLVRDNVPAEPAEYCAWRQESAPSFFFDSIPKPATLGQFGQDAVQRARALTQGQFPFFGYTRNLHYPPNWLQDPENCGTAPDGHWSHINEFASGDIKFTWEISRFSWVYLLSRAYARTRDERFAEIFWALTENWMEHNRPNQGLNWKCGQEASFRILALCFGFFTFNPSSVSTQERLVRLVTLIAVLGHRIAAYAEYAESQKNNHGISEAVGLLTVAMLFPELRSASAWKVKGRNALEFEVRRQIYNDGSYIQHSTNYHRLMLQLLEWAARLDEIHNEPLSQEFYQRFRSATTFLRSLVDPESGWAPNLGANDGAHVLPLSDCEFPDMRPVVQSCTFLLEGKAAYPAGPWDEEMFWLSGASPLSSASAASSVQPTEYTAPAGGYYTAVSGDSWVLLRGAKFRDRPSHADQLHVDLWWRGQNVLCDSGSYSYNSPPPFDHSFATTRFHNTVTVDSRDQMERTSRFLWTSWANAVVSRQPKMLDGREVLQGEHDGYAKVDVIHRRAVFSPSDGIWVIVDDLVGAGGHDLVLHWLLPDYEIQSTGSTQLDLRTRRGPLRIALAASQHSSTDLFRSGVQISGDFRSAPAHDRGWISRYYGQLSPALSLAIESRATLPHRFVTLVSLGEFAECNIDSHCTLISLRSLEIELSAIGDRQFNARFIELC